MKKTMKNIDTYKYLEVCNPENIVGGITPTIETTSAIKVEFCKTIEVTLCAAIEAKLCVVVEVKCPKKVVVE
jgi:hypothetical protein